MNYLITYLLSGCLLGLFAGVSPGPLLALVVSETLQNGRRAGLLVSVAPLITDLPIIVASLYVLSRLSDMEPVLGVISLFGACFLGYMAYGNLTVAGPVYVDGSSAPPTLGKGILVNVLSPHPYLFWISVGGPIVIKASSSGYLHAGAYVAGFYVFLVGSKVAVACLVDRSRGLLSGKRYTVLVKVLGGVLLVFAALFVREGLVLLDIIQGI